MKNYKSKTAFAAAVLMLIIQLGACADRFHVDYIVELPKVPSIWVELLGEPDWRVEWVNPDGQKQIADFPSNFGGSSQNIAIEIPSTWTSAVIAWPYWPAFNLPPKMFKPAGALFPFDVSGSKKHKNRLDLSWEAGVDAVFYWELVSAYNKNDLRIPTNFDWLRFRELFQAGTLNEEVLQDPWLVDWKSVAVRTVESGFDRRRIVPQETESVYIAIAEHLPGKWQGLWYGASPFAKPLEFEEWELPVFSVRNGINIWISSEGILRISGNNWVFLGISRKEY